MAWKFYRSNATLFVKDFGLMPGLIDELGLSEPGRKLLLAKLSFIHSELSKISEGE